MVPLVGEIACGQPSFAVENIEESYALPQSLFGSGELYMLRTFGDSMIDIGIKKGDLIVVRKQNYANDGDVIVAMVDGETTLKRLYHDGKDNEKTVLVKLYGFFFFVISSYYSRLYIESTEVACNKNLERSERVSDSIRIYCKCPYTLCIIPKKLIMQW